MLWRGTSSNSGRTTRGANKNKVPTVVFFAPRAAGRARCEVSAYVGEESRSYVERPQVLVGQAEHFFFVLLCVLQGVCYIDIANGMKHPHMLV